MKAIYKISLLTAVVMLMASSCIKEVDPQTSTITEAQALNAPGAYQGFVDAITGSLVGEFTYSGSNQYPWDYGYPSFYLMWDVMGQDIVPQNGGSEWYSTWYQCGTGLGPNYAVCQLPWTYYYKWIKNCNTVLSVAGENPEESQKHGAGIAHAMRAMFYMDLARMYSEKSYAADKNSPTVPIVDENTTPTIACNNPRATNEKIWSFIIEDLDKAETLLSGFIRPNKYVPDTTVVYGLKARAYLETEDYVNAATYAKKAQNGYTILTQAQYLSKTDGFNTPNDAWMFGLTFKSSDPNILGNDADSCWGSQMIPEVSASGCGYAANYVGPKRIDAHLYSTIPATDFRKMCFIDPAIDAMTQADALTALAAYTDDPAGVYKTGYTVSESGDLGCVALKFRPKNGEHKDQYAAFCVAVPIMRVEEMYLIEAEATGMQPGKEAEGIALLTAFAKTRDASYTYGTHNDMYYNTATPAFQNECWWQRRVELWGEGFATKDIKRLNKGIIRSYAGTNHIDTFQWNSEVPPQWMTLCFVGTEANYNVALVQNTVPEPFDGNSPAFVW